MRLRITDTNFLATQNWVFKLTDENVAEYYIMSDRFYANHDLKNPIGKKELDDYDKGQWINASVKEVDGLNVVVEIRQWS